MTYFRIIARLIELMERHEYIRASQIATDTNERNHAIEDVLVEAGFTQVSDDTWVPGRGTLQFVTYHTVGAAAL